MAGGHCASTENFEPRLSANSIEARPGDTTGMSSTERSAVMPESLMVSMHTAS